MAREGLKQQDDRREAVGARCLPIAGVEFYKEAGKYPANGP